MSEAYQKFVYTPGGHYSEGMVGTFSSANPLFAAGSVDQAVSRLVFSGLLRYDDDNKLVGDLASEYRVDEVGKIYTVVLKRNLYWHDGKPLTAKDVVFTFQSAQNPDVHSVLRSSWKGVKISSPDDRTVVFTLPTSLSSFPASLTTGIIPKHILGTVPAANLRADQFNTTKPVGSGPFRWESLNLGDAVSRANATSSIILSANEKYHLGKPKLQSFTLHTYETLKDVERAFDRKDVLAIGGLKANPTKYQKDVDSWVHSFQSTAALMAFFNLESNSPVKDKAVREALLQASSRKKIISELNQPLRTVREPVLIGQFAFDAKYVQPRQDIAKAAKLLDEDGWKLGKNGIRKKDGRELQFRLYAEDTEDNRTIAGMLKKQWRDVGVDCIIELQSSMYFQTTVETRSYDAVLYNVSIGSDPDVYAYWHSSQATSGGMNLSNYKSKEADTALEAGRTRQDTAQRALKYKPFLKAWREDVPAIALLRPRIYYVAQTKVDGLTERTLNTDTDRYFTVHKWQIKEAYRTEE